MHNSRGKKSRLRKKIKTRDEVSGIVIGDEPFLPDDLIMEIVCRLSIQDALTFRCVYKRVRDLIMSRDFMNLLKIKCNIAPMILVMNGPRSRQQFLLEKFWESECTRSEIHKSCQFYPENAMKLSHNGLIVSKNHKIPGDFVIFNPIYRENVKITVPSIPESEILGVFYLDAIKEYCTLWEITVSSRPVNVQYKMLNLGSQPKWKEITNPWTPNGRIQDIRPVSVNEHLYWVVEPEPFFRYKYSNIITPYNVDIMEFDTRTERFEVIHCPVPVSFLGSKCNISLLHVNGLLLLVQVYQKLHGIDINIWTLKDRVNKTWTRSEYIVGQKLSSWLGLMPKAVAFWNGEIVIQSKFQELFVCNNRLGTTRKIGKEKYQSTASFVSHVMSLASLKNCKSEICMVEKDENRPKNVWWKRLRRMRSD